MRILVADDDPQMQLALKAGLMRAGHEVTTVGNGKSALQALDEETFDLLISDRKMPEMDGRELLDALQKKDSAIPIIMITAYGTISQAVEAMQLGAADFITKPFAIEELERIVERVTSPELKQYRSKARKTTRGRPVITNDVTMIRVLEIAEAVARSDATVLLQGESGTGKELVARLVHSSSARAQMPFVAVNCAALPDNLLESELFGHEKGAFTGAMSRKIGKFELAHGGTILLDEISEMDLALQAKLLRVLQEREVDRVGGRDPIPIDVRVVATTNRNIEALVADGGFRGDLYYRLNVIPLVLPPLRERRSDVKLLVEHFMDQYLGRGAPALSEGVLRRLCEYHWPGNVRELQNAVERAAILSRGGQITAKDFLLDNYPDISRLEVVREETESVDSTPIQFYGQPSQGIKETDDLRIRSGMTVGEMEKNLILETLRATSNNRSEAAKLLGISIRTLRNKLNEYRQDGGEISEFDL